MFAWRCARVRTPVCSVATSADRTAANQHQPAAQLLRHLASCSLVRQSAASQHRLAVQLQLLPAVHLHQLHAANQLLYAAAKLQSARSQVCFSAWLLVRHASQQLAAKHQHQLAVAATKFVRICANCRY